MQPTYDQGHQFASKYSWVAPTSRKSDFTSGWRRRSEPEKRTQSWAGYLKIPQHWHWWLVRSLQAQEPAMLKTTATTITLTGGDRHIMAPIVRTAPWRPCLPSVAITTTRLIISQNAGYHPRQSTTFRVSNWTKRLLGPAPTLVHG